jgi:hypothetical protein
MRHWRILILASVLMAWPGGLAARLYGTPAAVAQAPDESIQSPTSTPAPTLQAQNEPTPTPTFQVPDEPTFTPTPNPTPVPTDTLVPTVTPTPTKTTAPSVQPPGGTVTSQPTATNMPTPSTQPSGGTPTVTPLWPTDTPTPTPTWSATPACADGWEPNQQPGSGAVLVIDQAISSLTLYPEGDVDFFLLWGKGGRYYRVTTATGDGLDTRIQIFDPVGDLVAENDDFEPGNPAGQVKFQAPGEGWFAVKVDSRVPTDWGCRGYSITAVDVSPPTPTPTHTPGPPPPSPTATGTPTPVPGQVQPDEYEPNYDFNTAANIGVGQTVNLNFNAYPPGSAQIDNDYFRLYVKVEERLLIKTANLAQGLDTNLILYRDNGAVIAGNDDCVPGERYSCIEWAPDYTGLAYVLAGPVGTIPEATAAGSRAYSLTVEDIAGQTSTPMPGGNIGVWPTPTSVYGQPLPWPVTPIPPTSVAQAQASGAEGPLPMVNGTAPITTATVATSEAVVRVRPISVGPPTPTPRPMQSVTVELSVYYDENDNKAPDANEGVAGLSVRVLNASNNELLGQAFTDQSGHTNLTVAAPADVRVSVPYLGYNQSVQPPGKALTIRLVPMRLPSLIP